MKDPAQIAYEAWVRAMNRSKPADWWALPGSVQDAWGAAAAAAIQRFAELDAK